VANETETSNEHSIRPVKYEQARQLQKHVKLILIYTSDFTEAPTLHYFLFRFYRRMAMWITNEL